MRPLADVRLLQSPDRPPPGQPPEGRILEALLAAPASGGHVAGHLQGGTDAVAEQAVGSLQAE